MATGPIPERTHSSHESFSGIRGIHAPDALAPHSPQGKGLGCHSLWPRSWGKGAWVRGVLRPLGQSITPVRRWPRPGGVPRHLPGKPPNFLGIPVPECHRRAGLKVAAVRRDGSPGRTPRVARLRGPNPGRAPSCRHEVAAGTATARGPFIRNSSPISRGSVASSPVRAPGAGAGPCRRFHPEATGDRSCRSLNWRRAASAPRHRPS